MASRQLGGVCHVCKTRAISVTSPWMRGTLSKARQCLLFIGWFSLTNIASNISQFGANIWGVTAAAIDIVFLLQMIRIIHMTFWI